MHSDRPCPSRRLRLLLWVLLLVLAAAAVAPSRAQAQANITGQWSLLSQTMPINPIHVALLHTGRVLIVAGSENDPTVTTYRAAVYDPSAGTFSVQTIPWDLFCNAMSFLPDGRVLTTGGNLQYNPFTGIRTTTIFDPATEQFTQVQDMAHGRWYPSNVALADGSVMTFSGWLDTGGTNNAVQIYQLTTGWSPEAFAPFTPPLYPWLHLLPNGKVFESGAQAASAIFDPPSQTWTTGVATTHFGQDRNYGSSVLLPLKPSDNYRARIMIMGGWPGGSAPSATDTAEIIDLSAATPAWQTLPSMSAPRVQMNAVLLPNGKVLALGGSASNETDSTASLGADLFDPATLTWSSAGTMFKPRMYHSVALLMPDATVWVAGSNPFQGNWDNSMEVYRPAYLFNASGGPATRPTITAAPAQLGYNTSFQVTTPDATSIASVALVRAGSATHAFNFEQRLVNLTFTAAGGTLTLTSPPNSNVAPPGYYLLFLINNAGVPSVASWVQLTATPGNQPPEGSITSPSTDVTIRAGGSVTFAGSGTDPDGTVASYAWVFPGGTPSSSNVANPGAIVFSTPGTYDVSLIVTDNDGASDPSPPVRRITVQPAVITASFTAPAANATVAGTQPVGMAVTNASGSSNTFTLTIDGTQVFTTTTSATSASFSWDTRPFSNGPHTLGLTVRDAAGNTATTQITVSVNNNVSSGEIGVTFPNLSPGQTVRGVQGVQIQAANTAGSSNRFEISVDGVVKDLLLTSGTSVTWNWNTMGLTNGSHTIAALVYDSTGRSGTNSMFVTVQNGLSVALTSPASGATVSGVTWADIWVTSPAPGTNVFTLSVDGVVVATQSDPGVHVTVPWDTTKTPNGAKTLVAQVVDSSNNGGQFSRPVTVNNTINPPAASFTSPAAGVTVSATAAVGLKATGGTAPYTYRLTIDSTQVFQTTTSATTASFSWNTTTYVNGGHALGLTVTDSRGNSTSATRIVNSQNGPQSLAASFSSPAAGATVSGTAVAIGMAASGGTAPYTYRLTVDGTQVFTTTTSTTTASFSWNSTTVGNGAHTLGLAVTDSASGSATATRSVTVQNGGTGLTAAFTAPAAGATVSGAVTVGMSAGGGAPGYTYTLTVDGTQIFTTSTTATTASTSWNSTTVANGSHTLGLAVTDTAGGSATATRTVSVNNTTGTLQVFLTQPSNGSTVSGTNWAVIWVSGTSGTSNVYTLSVGAQVVGTQTTSSTGPVSIPWDTTRVPQGTQTLTASVRDATGNTGSSSVTVTVQNGSLPLSASFTSPAAGATITRGSTVSIGMAASGGSPAYTYRLTIDGTQVFTTTTSATTASFSWNTTGVAAGSHTLDLTVSDTAGGSSTATRSVTVTAGTPPTAAFTAPAAGATVQGTVAVNMSASGGTAPYTYVLTIDGTQVFTTTTSATTASFSWNTTTYSNAAHTLGLTVTDSTGASGSATRSVTVNNPSGGTFNVFITAPSSGQTVSGTQWVTIWNDSTAAGSRTYTLAVGATTVWNETTSGNPVSLPWVTTSTPNGQQTLVVTVRDPVSATGSSSVTVTVSNP
jgi:hypothetical protein